jgi:hypothetical protein
MIKFDNFSTKKLNLKIKIPLLKKNPPKKLISRHNMQQDTLTRREY